MEDSDPFPHLPFKHILSHHFKFYLNLHWSTPYSVVVFLLVYFFAIALLLILPLNGDASKSSVT